MIVSFSGLDGTGKTTQAELLVDYLRAQGVDCIYRHAIKNTLYYFIVHNIVGKVSPKTKSGLEKGLRQDKSPRSFNFLSQVKKLFLLIDVIYFKLRYGSYKANRQKTIICDRYFFDEMVQAEYLSVAGDAFLDLYGKFLIEPDITFFADVEPGLACSRKEEDGYGMDYFNAKSRLYNTFMEKRNAVKLASGEKQEIKEIITSHWDKVYTK